MRNIFIAYADHKMAYSLKHIGRQADNLGFFDEIRLLTPDSLPEEVRNWDLMQYSYGGGYWAWKPYIIWNALQNSTDDDTAVFYIDAGCTIKKSSIWPWLARLVRERKTVLFQYKETMPEWRKFGSDSSRIKHWTKRSAIEFYDSYVGHSDWSEANKIWGGCIIACGKDNNIINQWVKIVSEHPEIIKDPEQEPQLPFFAQHKHDQPLLVALSQKYSTDCIVLPEFQESFGEDVPIYASRIRARDFKAFIIDRLKYHIRKMIGAENMNKIKKILTK